MTPKKIALIVVVVVVVAVLALFYIQNADTRVNVIFKLTPGLAWDLGGGGVALPVLLFSTFLGGFAVAALGFGGTMMARSRRARSLERQVASLEDELAFHRNSPPAAPPSRAYSEPAVKTDPDGSFDDLI